MTPNDGWDDGCSNLSRMLDEMGPNYPDAAVTLIDALRGYIQCCERDRSDAILCDGWTFTKKEDRKFAMHIQSVKLLLKELVDEEINPSLGGTIEVK